MDLIEKVKSCVKTALSDLSVDHTSCFGMCNDITSVKSTGDFRMAWTYRTYCKKACGDDDSSTFEECVSGCEELCYKQDIKEDSKAFNIKFLDRSPGDRGSSVKCLEVCTAGCRFRQRTGGFDETDDDSKDKKDS
ncbi:unnamed protein product [Vitrella brassicaformis CCMP3155]|uniref:Uncharacterized protein n=1 Tax=Vitrella brassicaformis (strain CCMP3155) TaxID=1169540 RepID=A0A0G4ERW2_VITBC|nr:unnamed protein product [Vitrella brassicaformis CCMP3155]|eukprot:CEM00605.1 unnamed protein product [Vitrella brassicaformis CCMP3155]